MDVYTALEDYCIWHETMNHSSRTVEWYRHKLGLFFAWLERTNRSTQVNRITVADARAFIHEEQHRTIKYPQHPSQRPRVEHLSDRTVDSYVRTIRAFFRWLHEEQYLTANPMHRLKRPQLADRIKEIVTPEELAQLLAPCNQRTFLGARMYALLCLMYDTGLRASEIVGLDVDDVQLRVQQIRVLQGKDKKDRLVPFSHATLRALRLYAERRASFLGDDPCTAFFLAKDKTRMGRGALTQVIKRHGGRYGVPRLHPHLLRHSAAVISLMNGATQFEVKRLLGHASLHSTDGYMALAEVHLREQHRKFAPMNKVASQKSVVPGRTRTGDTQ